MLVVMAQTAANTRPILIAVIPLDSVVAHVRNGARLAEGKHCATTSAGRYWRYKPRNTKALRPGAGIGLDWKIGAPITVLQLLDKIVARNWKRKLVEGGRGERDGANLEDWPRPASSESY